MKKKNGSGNNSLRVIGKPQADFQMNNPHIRKMPCTSKELAEYIDDIRGEYDARISYKVEKLEKDLDECRNERSAAETRANACGCVTVILITAFILALLCGWIYTKPAAEKQVERAYTAAMNDLNSRLESSWKEKGPVSYTIPDSDFSKWDYANIEVGTTWLDFCDIVNIPSFHRQFPFEYVVLETDTTSYEFIFEDEKLTEKNEVETPEPSQSETDSGNKTSNSPQRESRSTPSPTADPGMVWIPTNGGKRYHRYSTCSGMDSPEYVTIEEAESRGFTPCGKCW